MKRLKETEYMYAAARVRALENRLVGRERIDALMDARSADEVLARLSEYGLTVPSDEGAVTVTPEQAEETCGVIRDTLAAIYGKDVAESVTIQYGGSMNEKNASELLAKPNVDGGLIGGASLVAEKFRAIVDAAQ